jgi:tryptophan 2,3-dioxygenase
MGPDGHVKDRIEFWSEDDEKAQEHAKQYVDGHDIELWHRDKKDRRIQKQEVGCAFLRSYREIRKKAHLA